MKKKQFIIVFFLLFASYFTLSQTAPIANNDSYSPFVNTHLNTDAPGILENDIDNDGDVLRVTKFLINGVAFSADQTATFGHGTLTIFEDGSFTFTPSQNFKGNLESIIYIITDGKFTSYANINISVTVAPSPPIANSDQYNTFVNTPLNQLAPGILENDTDADADVLKVTQFMINGVTYNVGQTANFNQGSIKILQDGSFTFTPLVDFLGDIDAIEYTITDGTFTSSANVTISVIIPPSPPIANDDSYQTFVNTPLNEIAPGILRNDTDADGDVLKVTQFSINGVTYNAGQTATFPQGRITILEDGSFNFIPSTDFNGVTDSISYTITDGLFTSSASITITIIIPPTPPSAIDDYNTADENKTLLVPIPGVLINDTDVNQDILTVTEFLVNGTIYSVGQTANLAEGDFTLFQDGSYTLAAAPNYTGDFPVINYAITDGTFTSSANLFLTIAPTENLLEIRAISSCNQGFTSSGNYKIRYDAIITNRSNAKDYHPASLIKNINLTNDLQAIFGSGCLIQVDQVSIRNDNIPIEDYSGQPYPKEFTNNAVNPDFLNGSSNNFFSEDAVNNLTLYPRQSIYISYCVTIKAFCNGRQNPTPSGSGIDFTNILNVTDSSGGSTNFLTLKDFHTTEAVVSAALYVPEFNNTQLNPPGTANPNGTFDYVNTVIITNEGSTVANNVNFNMGLRSFISNGIIFDDIKITQVSGPAVTINPDFDGITNTNLLTNNNNLPGGETIRLEVYYLISPYSSSNYSFFSQINTSQTQGSLDGFDESSTNNKRIYSFVTWSDGLGNHVDRYYFAGSANATISAESQCSCRTIGMRFLFTAASNTTKVISNVNKTPNGILEHEEITYQITIKNTSESVQLSNLQIQDNLASTCGGKIISVGTPIISSSSATSNPTINPNFNGISDRNLFSGSDGILQKDETITVQFSVVYNETCSGTNRAVFTSRNPLNAVITSAQTIPINASTDSDNDGIPNSTDIDDDNDTIPDIMEYNGLNPLDDDDNDNIPNYRDIDFGADANGDGIVDIFDFDNDGVPNHLDLDSDNDGILDIVEAGNSLSDTNRNGRTNNPVGANGLDNIRETNDSITANISFVIPNTDNNSNRNFLDIDADDDGIVDNIEAQLTASFIPLNGIFSENGIDTAYQNGLIPIDTENDGIPDYLDTNSDNDIRDDIVEGWDTNADGIPEITPSNSDADNDGLDDAFDTNDSLVNPSNGQNPTDFPNVDNTDTPERDWREIIAIFVLITDVNTTEGNTLDFKISLVTKNSNSVLIESTSPITVNFTTTNGTETTTLYDVATAPFDYIGELNSPFTIPPFTNTINFSIATLDDTISELDELFTLAGIITSNNTINSSLKAIGTIIDNEFAPSIVMNDSKENEGVPLIHTITISHPSSTPISIDVNTSDNLAMSPNDYTSFSEILTINGTTDPNNATTEISFSINSNTDNLNELDEETINVIGTVTTSNVGNQDLNKTATIVDIDPNPLIFINDVIVEEGEMLQFSISLLNANLEPMQNYIDINLILETIDNTTFANEDYVFVNVLRTIPALTSSINQTVNSINDKLNEDTETFILQAITNLDNVSNTFFPSGVGTLKDNDFPNLFSPNGDGKSDVFKISGIVDSYPNFKISIYNRQGNEVFKYSNNGNTNPIWWDGSYNGKPVATGVYFYTLEYNDGVTKPKTNFIQLIR